MMTDQHTQCNTCGNQLVLKDKNLYYCESCGRVYKKESKDEYDTPEIKRAGDLVRDCMDFEEAERIYDRYILEHPESCEAYWDKFLVQNKIVYVEDGAQRMVPTFADVPTGNYQNNPSLKKAMELASEKTKEAYLHQIDIIEANIQEWKQVKKEEKPYDIFISYKDKNDDGSRTDDSYTANELYNILCEKKYRVFFSRVSMAQHQGKKYEPYIYNALDTAKVMLVCGSREEYFNAKWVKNEWTRFSSKIGQGQKKPGALIPVLFDGMDPYELPSDLRKLQALDKNDMKFIESLTMSIQNIVRKNRMENTKLVERNVYIFDPSEENINDKIDEWKSIVRTQKSAIGSLAGGAFAKVTQEIDTYIAYKKSDIPPDLIFLYLRAMTRNYTLLGYGKLDGVFNAAGELRKLEELKARINQHNTDLTQLTGLKNSDIDKECPGEILSLSQYKKSLSSAIDSCKERAEKEAEQRAINEKYKHEQKMQRAQNGYGGGILSDAGSFAANLFKTILTIVAGVLATGAGILIPTAIVGTVDSGITLALILIAGIICLIRLIKRVRDVWEDEEMELKSTFFGNLVIALIGSIAGLILGAVL